LEKRGMLYCLAANITKERNGKRVWMADKRLLLDGETL
jgi:hypothetical protein